VKSSVASDLVPIMAYCCYDSVPLGDRRYLNESRIYSGLRRQIDGMAASSWSVIEKSGFSARTTPRATQVSLADTASVQLPTAADNELAV